MTTTNRLLDARPRQLLRILRYQFNRYWSSVDYDPTTIELFQISPSLFAVWLLQQDAAELWPAKNKKQLLPGITREDARNFENLFDEELDCRRLLMLIDRCWSLITTTASNPCGITVLGTAVHYVVQLQVEGQELAKEIRIETSLSAESYGGSMQEPDLLQIWNQSLQNAAGILLHDRLRGLSQGVHLVSSLEGVRDVSVPKPMPQTTRVPGQDPFQFQPQTRSDPADEELAAELRALLEIVKRQNEEIVALQKDIDVLKQHAGLL